MNPPPISVTYSNIRQEHKEWCWAAVASNVYNALFPTPPLMSQCKVVQVVGQNCALPNAFSLVVALNGNPMGPGLHILVEKSTKVTDFLELILSQLGGGKPLSAEVHFPGVVHFVGITGADPATSNVWIADPFPGGPSVEFAIDAFLESYYFTDSHGQVQQSHGIVQALHVVTA